MNMQKKSSGWKNRNALRGTDATAKRRLRDATQRAIIEPLENRQMMNAVFPAVYGAQGTSFGDSGEILTGNLPVYLIYAGGSSTGFGYDGSVSAGQITQAVKNILASPYLTGLGEYGASTHAYVAGTTVSSFSLPTTYDVGSNINDLVASTTGDNGGPFPDPDDTDPNGIYFVFTPKGYSISGGGAIGEHDQGNTSNIFDLDHCFYGDVTSSSYYDRTLSKNLSPLDAMTVIFSHELAETITDPDPGDVVTTTPPSSIKTDFPGLYQNPGEIGDNEAQLYTGFEGDNAVQSLWSAANGDYRIAGGTKEDFLLNGSTLVINGDQYGANYNDIISLGETGAGGVSVTLNGETDTYAPGQVSSVQINSGGGQDTIFIQATVVPTSVNSRSAFSGPDTTVIVGNGGNTSQITSPLTISNSTGFDVLDISDSTDSAAHNVRVADASTPGYGSVTGLTPVEIDFPYYETRQLYVDTGTGGNNTVNVVATGVPTNVTGHSSGGGDVFNVGSNGSLANIRSRVQLDAFGYFTANVNDGTDTTARTVTLADSSQSGYGSITGLGGAEIDYQYAATSNLNVTLGVGGNTVNVNATGSPTTLLGGSVSLIPIIIGNKAAAAVINPNPIPIPILYHGGPNTVNVGKSGSAQNIRKDLTIDNSFGQNTINIDDGSDTTARTVTLDDGAKAADGGTSGAITGLTPGTITYAYDDTASLAITLGVGGNTANVRSTGSPTSLQGGFVYGLPIVLAASSGNIVPIPIPFPRHGGPDTINVGKNGSVQTINAPLTIDNDYGQDTITVDDGTDTAARTVTLDTITPALDPVPYGTITGLAPAAINYAYAATKSLGITLGVGGNTVNVLATGAPTSFQGGSVISIIPLAASEGIIPFPFPRHGGPDTFNIENAGNAQNVNGALTIENSYGQDTITVDDSADATPRSVTLGTAPPAGNSDPFGTISGLAPATITYEAADTASLTINAGGGGNTFTVTGTPTNQLGSTGGPGVTLNAGTGNDNVTVTGLGAGTTLTVNGQAGDDTLTADFSAGGFAVGATLNYDGGAGNNSLNVTGANAADAFNIITGQVIRGTDIVNDTNIAALGFNTGTFNVASDLSGAGLFATGAATTVKLGSSQHLAALNLNGSSIKLAAGGNSLDASALSITGGGKLDLADGSLQVHYGAGPDPLAAIRSYIFGGYPGGAWNGAGVNTSNADAKHGLGYADSADGVVSGLAANTVLVKYALYGDLNLDGKVDFTDLVILAAHQGKNPGTSTWDQGDVNYDGNVDFADLVKLAANKS